MLHKLFEVFIRFLIFPALLCLFGFDSNQTVGNGQGSTEGIFSESMICFDQQRYCSAQVGFEKYLDSQKSKLNQETAAYYALLAALKNSDPHLETRLQYFMLLYSNSKYMDDVRYRLAKYFFQRGNFHKSCLLYESIKVDKLFAQDVDDYYYELGLIYLQFKELEKAKNCFEQIHTTNHDIYYSSRLQMVYIALEQEDYEQALVWLQDIEANSQTYVAKAKSLRLKVYYKSGAFETLLNYVNSNAIQISSKEDQLLVADACFFLGQYESCIAHYNVYLDGIGVVDRSTISKLACALYHVGEYTQSWNYFKKLLDKADVISQTANYYIGLITKHIGHIPQAIRFFDQAGQQDYNPVIQELALIRKASLLYEQGDFQGVITSMNNFIQQYKSSDNYLIAQTLLAQAYCKVNNYDLAVDVLESMACKDEALLILYQFVLFHQGLERYNEGIAKEAIQCFEKSMRCPLNKSVLLQSKFWMAEALSSISSYQQALEFYTDLIQQGCGSVLYYERALYGLGYAYFNLGNYTDAVKIFEQYLKLTKHRSSTTYYDGLLRLGDCYFVQKKYKQALKVYDSAYRYNPAHVRYHQALIYDILNDRVNEKKCIQQVITVHSNTKYYIKCLYHEACSIFKRGDYETATKKFTFLIQNQTKHELIPSCFMKRALAYENLKKNKQAMADYIAILEQYPDCTEAENALMALSNLFTVEGTPEKINPFLEKHAALAKKSRAGSEQRILDSAKAFFYSQKYNQVIQQLGTFSKQYPNSQLLNEAYFLMAESYFRIKKLDKAVDYYKKVVVDHQTHFYTKSWIRIAHIAYQSRSFQEAWNSYQRLQRMVLNRKETYMVLLGIAKTSFELKKYDITTSTCLQLLDLSKELPIEVLQEAYGLLGKVSLQRCAYKQAKKHFLKAQIPDHTLIGQEAQYLLAFIEFKLKAYQSSLDILFKLTAKAIHQVYIDKAFLLMADNYMALGSFKQAKVTLASIINKSKDKQTIALARKKMKLVMDANKVRDNRPVSKEGQKP